MKLVSKHKFLKLETATKAVFLKTDEKTEAGTISDAYLELKLGTYATF